MAWEVPLVVAALVGVELRFVVGEVLFLVGVMLRESQLAVWLGFRLLLLYLQQYGPSVMGSIVLLSKGGMG